MKKTHRASKYIIIGIILTLFNFIIFTILARLINNNDLLWIDTIISYVLATFLAYALHSKITWKERSPGQSGIIKFFLWNFLTALAISPFLTWLFKFITPLYQFAHQISTNLHLPFDYDFIESTGIFCFVTLITMTLNYLFYDKLVFGNVKDQPTKTLAKKSYSQHTRSKVSVIIPVFNTEKYLKKCLTSIILQTYQNLEIIIVDDGSTDNSGKIADEYAKKDKRIKVIHQKNAGQSAARNTGLKKATGDFVGFIDSDDFVAKTFIEKLLAPYLNDPNVALTICGLRYNWLKTKTHDDVFIKPLRKKRKNESKKAYVLYLLTINGRIYASYNKLYKKEYLKNIWFDKNLNFAEDTKFVLDYINNTPNDFKIDFILEALYYYNYGTETSTLRKTATDWKNWQTSYNNLKSWLGPNPTLREKFFLHLIYLRWRISHHRAKKRLKQW